MNVSHHWRKLGLFLEHKYFWPVNRVGSLMHRIAWRLIWMNSRRRKFIEIDCTGRLNLLARDTSKTIFNLSFSLRYSSASSSMTRFGKISLLWKNLRVLGEFFEGLSSIWQNVQSTFANILCYWGNFQSFICPKVEKMI